MHTFDLSFPGAAPRECAVCVGVGALDRLRADLAVDRVGKVVVVSDASVAALYGGLFLDRLRADRLDADLLTFPGGERSKTLATLATLHEGLAAVGAGRDARIVALGGGVTGDLAGFLAATWHRGVPFHQAPTTLLAMVDAAIGGKTGVDLGPHKNLVGAFHQAGSVHADLETLTTLTSDVFRHGLAEVVKTAMVADEGLFERIEAAPRSILDRAPEVLIEIVSTCARRKGEIVIRDERDTGARAALNFGHTVAHAVESVTQFRIAHGDAVAIGMVAEAIVAEREVGLAASDRARLVGVLEALGLPSSLPAGVDVDEVVRAAAFDKKNVAGRIRCALPAGIGRMPDRAAAVFEIDRASLRDALHGS